MATRDLLDATPERPVRVGQYQVTGLLGVGGMGDVYTAISEHASKVALKTLSNVAPERVLLFKNEFRYVADLAHPNLVPLYELNCDGDLWFFTMELVDGATLLDWLVGAPGDKDKGEITTALQAAATLAATPRSRSGARDGQPEPIAQPTTAVACDLGRFVPALAQLLDALEYLHQHGIVHQDLKPSNVLVRADGLVRLLDFGVASRIGHNMALRGVSTVVGTPAYMSPEQWRGLPATPSSDLFSLGCMMFQLLTGTLPFGATYDQAQQAPHVEDWVTGVPAPIAEVCHGLMARAPGERPSIAEVRTALGVQRAHSALDAAPSCWLIPIFHQFAALAGCAAWDAVDPAARPALRGGIEASLGELGKLAKHAPMNFAHRVSLVEAELRRIDGDLAGALALLDRSLTQAQEVSWLPDLALAHELAARCLVLLRRADEAALRRRAARDLYARWGAHAKVSALDAEGAPGQSRPRA